MKKLLLIALLSVFTVLTVNAQQLSYGVKAGANSSTMNAEDDKALTGFNGGIFGQLRIADFAVQPEVLLSMQGAKYSYNTVWDDMRIRLTGKVSTTYLSVPLMLQYYIIRGLAVEAGPQLGFLLSAKDKPDEWQSRDIKSGMKRTDFALNVGASYQLPAMPLGVYARYSLGLTNIYDDGHGGVFENSSGKNRMVQFGLFVRF